jgi:hypothetical protein
MKKLNITISFLYVGNEKYKILGYFNITDVIKKDDNILELLNEK